MSQYLGPDGVLVLPDQPTRPSANALTICIYAKNGKLHTMNSNGVESPLDFSFKEFTRQDPDGICFWDATANKLTSNPLATIDTEGAINAIFRPIESPDGFVTGIAQISIDPVFGLIILPLPGTSNELTMMNSFEEIVMLVPLGTKNVVFPGNLAVIGTTTHSDYTSLGVGNVKLKIKKLIGTTASTEGARVSIPHGLDLAKIIGIQALVNQAIGNKVTHGFTGVAGHEFSVFAGVTDILVDNIGGNSVNILSRPVTILITYEV